jgi:hypothetical protein
MHRRVRLKMSTECKDKSMNISKELKELRKMVGVLVKESAVKRKSSQMSYHYESSSSYNGSSSATVDDFLCDFCRVNGHNIFNCWWVRCDFCSKKGHTKEICIKYKMFLEIQHLEGQIELIKEKKQEKRIHFLDKKTNNFKNKKINNSQESYISKEVVVKEEFKQVEIHERPEEPSKCDKIEENQKEKQVEVKYEEEEDDFVLEMEKDLSDGVKSWKKAFKEAKSRRDLREAQDTCQDFITWLKCKKKRAKKELKETGNDEWEKLADRIDEIIDDVKRKEEPDRTGR